MLLIYVTVTLWLAGVPAGSVLYSVSFPTKVWVKNANFGSTVNIVAVLLFGSLLINKDTVE